MKRNFLSPTLKIKDKIKQQEKDLIAACINNDNEAWAVLQRDYGKHIEYHLKSLPHCDRDEVRNQIWLHLINNDYAALRKWKGKCRLSTWLDRLSINKIRDFIRARKRIQWSEIDITMDEYTFYPQELGCESYIEQFRKEKINEKVNAALDTLGEPQKQILIMRIFLNMRYRQIAERLNMPIGTVQSHDFRAREKIKQLLKNEIIEWGIDI